MSYSVTTATRKVFNLKKRIRVLQGGTSASKTISILLCLIHYAQSDEAPTLTSIVSETFPQLKKGAMRDFLNIMKAQNYFKEDRWNISDATYTFETGSQIEFFSADQSAKVRGPRRQRLFINECNNVGYDVFDQLEVRTSEFIFLDFNPVGEFWYHEELEGKRDDIDFLILTYKDNEALPPEIVKTIERRKANKSWWKVYGEGQLGEIEGRIYTDWKQIDEVPHEARLERYGIDFGYTNDPTAIIAVYYLNGGYILDEVAYSTGLLNKDIGDIILNRKKGLIVADSAEPKSIDDLKTYGLEVIPAVKGKDSVVNGIQKVQGLRISFTKSSVNLIKEYRNYIWDVDKTGKKLNQPEGGNDHAMDAVRYALNSVVNTPPILQELKQQLDRNQNRLTNSSTR